MTTSLTSWKHGQNLTGCAFIRLSSCFSGFLSAPFGQPTFPGSYLFPTSGPTLADLETPKEAQGHLQDAERRWAGKPGLMGPNTDPSQNSRVWIPRLCWLSTWSHIYSCFAPAMASHTLPRFVAIKSGRDLKYERRQKGCHKGWVPGDRYKSLPKSVSLYSDRIMDGSCFHQSVGINILYCIVFGFSDPSLWLTSLWVFTPGAPLHPGRLTCQAVDSAHFRLEKTWCKNCVFSLPRLPQPTATWT